VAADSMTERSIGSFLSHN